MVGYEAQLEKLRQHFWKQNINFRNTWKPGIINLYVRVLVFLCKGIIHKHKIKQKQVKAKALREEIQSASVDNEGQS